MPTKQELTDQVADLSSQVRSMEKFIAALLQEYGDGTVVLDMKALNRADPETVQITRCGDNVVIEISNRDS